MGFRFQFDELETFDADQYRDDSFQLEAFRVCDFDTAMDGELAKVISRGANVKLRYLPLIERITNDKASLYVKRPTRILDAGTVARTSKLEDIYQRSRIDRFMLSLQQRAEAQNSMIVAIDPHPFDPRAVVPRSFLPGEVSIESSDLMLDDIRFADSVKIRVPLKKETTVIGQERVLFGHRCYTRTEAYVQAPDGTRVGIYNDEMTNPFGYIPLLTVRLTEPRKGWHLPRLPLDLLSVQIGLIIGISDVENMVRLKAGGREVVVGQGARFAVSKINAGPEGIIPLEGDELSYQAVTTAPAVEKYLQAIETTVRLLANYKYTNPDGLWSSSGITGAAKESERQEMIEDRQRRETVFADFESDLVQLVADSARIGPSALSMGDATASINYHFVRSRTNDLQTAQASALNFALGLDSAVDTVSASEGITKGAAGDIISERLESWGAWVDAMRNDAGEVMPPPGLDSIATQVMGSASFDLETVEGDAVEVAPDSSLAAEESAKLIDLGISSPARELARRDGIGLDEARRQIEAVRDEVAASSITPSSQTSLNGAQILAALQVADKVSLGVLSIDGGIAFLVEGLGLSEDAARRALKGAKPAKVEPVETGTG